MRSLLVMLVLLLFPSLSSAAAIYVTQNAAGGDTGANCANAHSASWFNTTGNWGAGPTQIGPGTTLHLCGVITTELAARGSGASGSPITILWEPNAKISRSYCDTSGCFNSGGNSYLVLDGGTNGIIEATANGSPGSYANQQSGNGIVASGGSNLEIRNLTIQNLYVHTSSSDNTNISQQTFLLINVNNLSIHDNTLHDSLWTITIGETQSISGIDIYNNDIYNTDHGIALAGSAAVTVSNVNIYNNHIHDYANWDNTSNLYHHDGIHVYDAITTYANLSIYNNLFDGNIGENITAHVFVGGSIVTNMRVFNNVMTASNQPAGGSGFLVLLFSGTSDAAVYNNTFRCAAPGSGPGAVNLYTGSVTMQNNVMVNCGTFVIAASGSLAASGLNNNVYASASGGLLWKYGANFYSTLAGWRGATGQDASAVYTSGSAGLDSTFHPLTGSIVIGARTNLMSLGITALNSDKAGVARPASGAWDAGAYVFISNRPAPPTGLQVR